MGAHSHCSGWLTKCPHYYPHFQTTPLPGGVQDIPRLLAATSSWANSSSGGAVATTAALLDPAAAAEATAVTLEGRRATLLERESALQRWAVALELSAGRLAAAEEREANAREAAAKEAAALAAREGAAREQSARLEKLVRGWGVVELHCMMSRKLVNK